MTARKLAFAAVATFALVLSLAQMARIGDVDAQAATTVSLTTSKDTSLYSQSGRRSNGAGENLFSGAVGTRGGGALRRALLAFDVAGNVPAGSIITGAKLTLNVSRSNSGGQTHSLHKLLADWGEGASDAPSPEGEGTGAMAGDATWSFRVLDGETWDASGGDFEADASAGATVAGEGKYEWTSDQMVADVQTWLDDASTSFGWMLIGNERSQQTAKRFDSKENGTESRRPDLEITFTAAAAQAQATATPPPATATPPPASTATPRPVAVPVLISAPLPPTGGPAPSAPVLMFVAMLGALLVFAGTVVYRPRRET